MEYLKTMPNPALQFAYKGRASFNRNKRLDHNAGTVLSAIVLLSGK
jgi:hypothetical protein